MGRRSRRVMSALVVVAAAVATAMTVASPASAACDSPSSAVLAESVTRTSGSASLPFTGLGPGPFVAGVALVAVGLFAWWMGTRPSRCRAKAWRVVASLGLVVVAVLGANAGVAHAASPCGPSSAAVAAAANVTSVPEAPAAVELIASVALLGGVGWGIARRRGRAGGLAHTSPERRDN